MWVQGQLVVCIKRADGLKSGENFGLGLLGRGIAKIARSKNDAYVNVYVQGLKLGTTSTIDDTKEPVWDETFHFELCHDVDDIKFEVRDKNVTGSTLLGECSVPIERVYHAPDRCLDKAFPLSANGKDGRGELVMSIRVVEFVPGAVRAPAAVPDVYFPAREGNTVTLYQDAHNSRETLPLSAAMPNGESFEVHSCWTEIYDAISAAHKFVFLTGWSVHPDIMLTRGAASGEPKFTLGDLLKAKARQGVDVRLLVWDDRSSVTLPGMYIQHGVMGTHDEVTRKFFAGTAVQCQLVGRTGSAKAGNSLLEAQTAATCFSHHQKTVMCDGDPLPGRAGRRVRAFVGGLDLTKGRYDTAKHDLFRARDTTFRDDYVQPCFDTAGGWGPREPWEDIHCQLDGPAAHDVVRNFVERWQKQVDSSWTFDAAAAGLAAPEAQEEPGPDAFTVQVLRSIDDRSAALDRSPDAVQRLFLKKGRLVDRSILLAYIHQIRRAERFVFIENQYFLGSSFMWAAQRESRCSHTVPSELVAKIVSKIRAGQRFAAYIIQPLFPEGDPASDSVKAILQFQKLTMESMYKRIAEEIAAAGIDALPTDYLNFYCLGNRETEDGWQPPSGPEIRPDMPGALSAANRRFMIYVHSKLMIVDDEVAIIGSANINMRSLAGFRDTEIAAVLWQPAHTAGVVGGETVLPHGAVHGFRMSIWGEHLAAFEAVFADPGSVECVHRVNEFARDNWLTFMAPEPTEMRGHLMPYPISVARDGTVTECGEISGDRAVPDFPSAPMFGAQVNLPYVLTT